MKILLKQCKKQSRKVLKSDYPQIKEMAGEFIDLCREPLGKYPFAHALAHCQIDHNDPLRFFVTHDGRVIINPKMVGWNAQEAEELEACYSFPHRPSKKVKRFLKVYIDYQYMDPEGKVFLEKNKAFEGIMARVFQHEFNHFNSISIYDKYNKKR